MGDIVNISVSSDASVFADELKESGLFEDKVDVYTYAAAYVIKKYYKEFDPATYILTDTQGSNFGVSSIDPNNNWSILIKSLYPEMEAPTPYRYLRALIDRGLSLLEERSKQDLNFSIFDELV
ncbi:hypothetical protein [Candidatus Enterococcus murrayae]|uniref:Uncharacterized protein n=1 Tax=Candidatus Enterococcus murrayae TaxID=2815321 RepID=A0ABS3HNE9_9ENTE|nr:hypothetical protein [Enterococcus sp. MJM16]MBO0454984.1 hypothetical protein [Enterococcus sp. MJM16]